MYSVNRLTHQRHGPVIIIERSANGSQLSPFRAVQSACKERRLWKEEGIKKVRILIDDQILSPNQADHWAAIEYKSLPKCESCAKVLNENVHSHKLSSKLFCSIECSDKDYMEKLEIQKDEEEIDYL